MISKLSTKILLAGLDDWVPLAAVDGLARKLGSSSDSDAAQASLAAVRELAESRLVELGDVSDGGFYAWDDSTEEALTRIAEARSTLDPSEWGFFCWVRNTATGDTLARAQVDGSLSNISGLPQQ